MITIRLEPCCKNCHFSGLDLDVEKLYTGGENYVEIINGEIVNYFYIFGGKDRFCRV